jgi:hypothetical protein
MKENAIFILHSDTIAWVDSKKSDILHQRQKPGFLGLIESAARYLSIMQPALAKG